MGLEVIGGELVVKGVRYIRVTPKLGSQAGGMFKASDDAEYYLKFKEYTPEDEDFGLSPESFFRNEVLALKLYKHFGIHVPEVELIQFEDEGKQYWGIKTPKINSQTLSSYYDVKHEPKCTSFIVDSDKQKEFNVYKRKLWKGFIIDCLLANSDVIGDEFDNASVDTNNGAPLRLGAGSSLFYGKQGQNNLMFFRWNL